MTQLNIEVVERDRRRDLQVALCQLHRMWHFSRCHTDFPQTLAGYIAEKI